MLEDSRGSFEGWKVECWNVRNELTVHGLRLAAIAGLPFPVGMGPEKVVVDTTGKFIYVPSPFDNTIWGFTIDGTTGSLTRATGSPFMASSAADVVTIP